MRKVIWMACKGQCLCTAGGRTNFDLDLNPLFLIRTDDFMLVFDLFNMAGWMVSCSGCLSVCEHLSLRI